MVPIGSNTDAVDDRESDLDRPRRWSSGPLLVVGLLAACAASALAVLVPRTADQVWPISRWFATTTADWVDQAAWATSIAELFSTIGDIQGTSVLVTAVCVGLAVLRRWRLLAFVLTTALAGALLSELLKITIGRQRPLTAEDFGLDMEKSFPSGHAMVGIYVFGMLGLLALLVAAHRRWPWLKGMGVLLWLFGVSLGICRIILGVHWATDVLAGWLFGSAILLLSAALWRPDDAIFGVGEKQLAPSVPARSSRS